MLFDDGIYPCESGGGGGGGEKLVVRAEASIVGGLGVWLGLCRFIRVSEKKKVGARLQGKISIYQVYAVDVLRQASSLKFTIWVVA